MGAFPNLPRNVPFCPRLSSFVPICPRSGPQEGQKRTNGDKTGHFGTNWETPPFSIYPHLALLNLVMVMMGRDWPEAGRARCSSILSMRAVPIGRTLACRLPRHVGIPPALSPQMRLDCNWGRAETAEIPRPLSSALCDLQEF